MPPKTGVTQDRCHPSQKSLKAKPRVCGREVCASEHVDVRVLIDVEDDEFAVGLAEFDAVEPEFAVARVGVPRAGLLLPDLDDGALDRGGECALAGADTHARALADDLLRDADALAGDEA